jgi:hypothetical protein
MHFGSVHVGAEHHSQVLEVGAVLRDEVEDVAPGAGICGVSRLLVYDLGYGRRGWRSRRAVVETKKERVSVGKEGAQGVTLEEGAEVGVPREKGV